MANNGTFEEIKTLRQRIALAACEDQLTVALHRAQAAAQRFYLFFALNIQLDGQLIAAGRLFPFG